MLFQVSNFFFFQFFDLEEIFAFGSLTCLFLLGVALINISEAMSVLNRLGTSGLLLTEHSRMDINQSVSIFRTAMLSWWYEDVVIKLLS